MSLSLTAFSDGTTIVAADLLARVASTERFVNEQIVAGDLRATTWCPSTRLYPPDFFGSPHARVEATSFDVFFRFTSCEDINRNYSWTIFHADAVADAAVPVPGLCAPVWVESDSSWVTVIVSFYAFAQATTSLAADTSEATTAGTFTLYVDGAATTGTQRVVCDNVMMHYPRKQHSIMLATVLNKGRHDVGVYLDIESGVVSLGAPASIYVQPRNIIVLVDAK